MIFQIQPLVLIPELTDRADFSSRDRRADDRRINSRRSHLFITERFLQGSDVVADLQKTRGE